CERTCWPWNDTGTPWCAASRQGDGKVYGAARHTDTTDSGTSKRAEGLTFGVAHVPKGLFPPRGVTREEPLKINRTRAARTTSCKRRNCQSTCWQTRSERTRAAQTKWPAISGMAAPHWPPIRLADGRG